MLNPRNHGHQTSSSSSPSPNFGSFLFLASADVTPPPDRSRQHAIIKLDSGAVTKTGSGSDWPWQLNEEIVTYVGDHRLNVELENEQLNLASRIIPSDICSCTEDLESSYFSPELVGCCNGVLCFYYRFYNRVCLWNPCTQESRILPEPLEVVENATHSPRHVVVGFGYDGMEFKVVLFTGFSSMFYEPIERRCLSTIQLYRSGIDSWNLLKHSYVFSSNLRTPNPTNISTIISLPGDPFPFPSHGVYLNGAFFFLANHLYTEAQLNQNNHYHDKHVIAFDFATSFITPIRLPEHREDQDLFLTCLGDKLALFTKCWTHDEKDDTHYEYYDIWVKEHAGVMQNSWTLLDTFKIKFVGECNDPVGISNDGKFALLNTSDSTTGFSKKIKLFHLASTEVKTNLISCTQVLSKAFSFQTSKASISGGGEGTQSREVFREHKKARNDFERAMARAAPPKANPSPSQGSRRCQW